MPSGARTRAPWTDAERDRLRAGWHAVPSNHLLALALDRTYAGVQTEASRLGLPLRRERCSRAPWDAESDAALREAMPRHTRADGRLDLLALARSLNRKADALVNHLAPTPAEREALMARLVVPDLGSLPPPEPPEAKAGHRLRPCLCCRESFASEGPHNRMCVRCRETADTGGYGDFDRY